MDLLPVPELLVGVAIFVVVAGLRSLWRAVRHHSVPHPAAVAAQLRQEEMDSQRDQLIASCVMFAIISIPLILRVVPPNGMYGFRVDATRDPAIWYPANAFMGWALLLAAATSTTLMLRLPAGTKRWRLWATFLLPIVAA